MKEEYKLFNKIKKPENIYLAYLRVKNDRQNDELILLQEILDFEAQLEENIENIITELEGDLSNIKFEKFDFVTKIKKIKDDKIQYRPLTRYRFRDLVVMQSVFNVVFEELKNFIPKENYGVQLDDENSMYLYKSWIRQYKTFSNLQKQYLSSDSTYQCVFEYDIKQFYPSIQQEQLIETLDSKIDDKNVMILVKKIIKHFSKDNVTEETKEIFNSFSTSMHDSKNWNEDDLGLPQGPLFSMFLSSLYTRELFREVKNRIQNELAVEVEFFTYIDDGRLYFKDVVDETKIENIIQESLTKLNESTYNNKSICFNEEKCHFLKIDDKTITAKLNYLTSEISLMNQSVDQRFEIDPNTEEAILNKHILLKENIDNLYKKLCEELSKSETESINNEIQKLQKEYSTYNKRKATALSKKISSDDKYYELIDSIFEEYSEPTENQLNVTIADFNFYYVLKNFVENANSDYKIQYLFTVVDKFLQSYRYLMVDNNVNLMIYYDLTLIKIAVTLPYHLVKNQIEKIVARNIDNALLLKFIYSSTQDEWIYKYYENKTNKNNESIFLLNEKNICNKELSYDSEFRSIVKTLKVPISVLYTGYNYFKSITIDISSKKNIVSAIQIYSDDKSKKQINIRRYSCKNNTVYFNDKIMNFNKLTQLYEENIKIDYLKILIKYWKEEWEHKQFICPSDLVIDNIFIERFSDTNESFQYTFFIIQNLKNAFFDFKIYKHNIDYRELFNKFFKQLFDVDESFIISQKNRALKFWEYRILAYLDNHNKVDVHVFLDMLLEMFDKIDYYSHEVDINYERVRKIISCKLTDIRDKDIILQLHYFVQCIWKNGSKDLPFFTLHNQEHSLELITNYEKLSKKTLSYMLLDSKEIFILMASCYLHDIGMLKGLMDDEMYNIKDSRIINYYNDISDVTLGISCLKIESFLANSYKIFDMTSNLFETIVRGDHHIRSAMDIRSNRFLPLTDQEKDIIATVSNNHCEDTNKFYGKMNKTFFRNSNIDIRKISIWLRLLDLTDITKYRVTQEVFDRYFERMSTVSRFHWVKHLMVDKIYFKAFEEEKKECETINLGKTIIEIQIYMNYLPSEEKIDLSDRNCSQFNRTDELTGLSYMRSESKEKCIHCKLDCRFLNEFHYFDDEIQKINKYLELYQEQLEFKINYILKFETQRDDFVVIRQSNSMHHQTTALECIKNYIFEVYK